MRTEIIEILQKKYPEYCMQHIDTADEILRLFSVVGQSEQLSLCQCDKPSPDIMYGKTCTECCLEINPKA
jgi:hypothetical protein